MVNFEQELNAEQLAVVQNADGPCLVLAGAGSGKTRVITYRAAYLLERGVQPENILLVTFTNKAAREMIERVSVLVGAGRDAINRVSTLPWSGTFHHIAFKILKKYASLLGYQNNLALNRTSGASSGSGFSVLDSEDSVNLIKTCLKHEGIDRKEKRFPSPSVLQNIISYSRNSENTIENILDLKHPHFLPIADVIIRLAEDYQKRKLSANVMDFDDLLVNWHLLLRTSPPTPPLIRGGKPEGTTPPPPFDKGEHERTPPSFPPRGGNQRGVLGKYAEQFQYILVDEYQDTNKIQASIIDLLASIHKNILVVGDDAQSIYSFRAAEIKNILDFEKKYSSAKIFRLETNYRSTPDILNLANNIISNNLKQYEKNLKSIKEDFTKPEVNNFANQLEEAEFVAQRVKELIDEGIPAREVSVLFRAASHSHALEMELAKQGIVYDYRGGVRFFERAHIKDALAYLRVINNPEDAVAWRRVLNMQIGIGPGTAERIIEEIKNLFLPLRGGDQEGVLSGETPPSPSPHRGGKLDKIGAELPAKAQLGWSDFLQVYNGLKKIEDKNPAGLISAVVDSKYLEYLENEYPDYQERTQDLEQLAVFAEKYDSLNDFLAESSLQEGFRNPGQHPPRLPCLAKHGGQASPPLIKGGIERGLPPLSKGGRGDIGQNVNEKIILSTIHQAKGLEWEAVFVINLAEGQFPNSFARREQGGLEEERRLFYVAVTRAKKHLYLSYPLSTISNSLQGPSMFLEEIDSDLIQGSLFGGGNSFDSEEIVYEEENIQIANDANLRISNNKKRTGFLKDIEDL